MKVFFKIDDTGGYPEGIIPHMVKAVSAFCFHLNYFYDAHLFVNVAGRTKPRGQSHKEKSF